MCNKKAYLEGMEAGFSVMNNLKMERDTDVFKYSA